MGVADRQYMQRKRPSGSFGGSTVGRLLILCGIVFLLQLGLRRSAPSVMEWFVLSRDALFGGRIWTLLTYATLHADFSHVLYNAIGIWIFGELLEGSMPPREFLRFTVLAALFGGLAHVLSGSIPVVGASAIVMGYLALGALRFPRVPFRIIFLPISFPLWLIAVVYIGYDVVGVLRSGGNVAHFAHLGGAAYGLVCWRLGRVVPALSFSFKRGASKPSADRRPPQRLERSDHERRRVDALLEKISRDGITSLSDEERAFLNEASKRYR
jgi:membrane associated rhomboid family serine protease